MSKFDTIYESMMESDVTTVIKGKTYKVGDDIWYNGEKVTIKDILKNNTMYGDSYDLSNGIRTGGLDPRMGAKNKKEVEKNFADFRSIFK
jgi:hypothetical protein